MDNRKIGNSKQICSVERVTVFDGRAKGINLIYCSNGKLNFVLIESNCLDIFRLWHKGTNIGFISKNGLYSGMDAFSNTFPGGMLYTCGLDNIGARDGYRLHGRVHSVPAQIKSISADENGIEVVGEIKDTALFGQHFVLTRTIKTSAFSDEIVIEDELKNQAWRDENYCMLYHVNVGYPMIDAGIQIKADIKESFPRTEFAQEHMSTMLVMEEPSDNMEETCYFHRLNNPIISIRNELIGKLFTLHYSDDTLPYFVEWKSRASGDYVIGLEPSTSWLDNKFCYRTLKSGQTIKNFISIKIEDIK